MLIEATKTDPIAPILHKKHIEAINRRMPMIFAALQKCVSQNGLDNVIVENWSGPPRDNWDNKTRNTKNLYIHTQTDNDALNSYCLYFIPGRLIVAFLVRDIQLIQITRLCSHFSKIKSVTLFGYWLYTVHSSIKLLFIRLYYLIHLHLFCFNYSYYTYCGLIFFSLFIGRLQLYVSIL